MVRRGVAMIDRGLERVVRGARWLAIPLVLILFLQWPLRDLVRGWSREANDLGQCLFALFVAVAVTAATRSRRHLAVDTLSHGFAARTKRVLTLILLLAGLVPWAGFLLVAGWPALTASLLQRETFPDTGNPGYFLIRLAGWALALLVLLQAVREGLAHPADPPEPRP